MNAKMVWEVVLAFTALPLTYGAVTAEAAPPPFTYQGQLKLEGTPVSGTADFRAEVYGQATGGTALCALNPVYGVDVQDGLFTIQLQGCGDVFSNPPVYLEVSVAFPAGGTFVLLTPRQMVTPAPMAYYAFEAPSSGGDSPWTSVGDDIYYDDGQVGVGTTSPSYDLHVVSSGARAVSATTSNVGGRALFGEATAVTGSTAGVVGSSRSVSGKGVYGQANASSGVVYGVHGECNSTSGRGVYGQSHATTGTTYGVYGSSAGSSGRGVYGYNDGAGFGVFGKSSSGAGVWAESSGSSTLYPALYAYNSNVDGIGVFSTTTSTDANAVFVNRGAGPIIKGFSGSSGNDHIFGVDNDGHVGVGRGPSSAIPLDVLGGNNWDVAGGDADLRIGDSSYGIKMGVALNGLGAGSARIFAQGGNHKLTLGSNDEDVLTIVDSNTTTSGDGYVGIGTPDPEQRLHVVGKMKVEGVGSGTSVWVDNGATAVYGDGSNTGVKGVGDTYGMYASGGTYGLRASGTSYGVYSSSDAGTAVYGYGTSGTGVYGKSNTDIGVSAYAGGTGTSNPALKVENWNAGGIAVFSTTNSTDANAVFVNKGTGDLIKGFTGASGGDLVFRVQNDGKTSVSVLQITGGSDLAEQFDVTEDAQPGMVVAIDPKNPGKLCIARGAYNRRVAGVISGANDLEVGMVLADLPGSQNSQPIALSGRVWVRCDATDRAIEPGDMLTTADRPGYAMVAADARCAYGTVIGKAMSGLDKGATGMVLVLVNLQ